MQSIGTLARTVLADLRERMDEGKSREGANPLPASDARPQGGTVARFGKGAGGAGPAGPGKGARHRRRPTAQQPTAGRWE